MPQLIAPLVGSMLLAQIITTVATTAISYGISYYQKKRAEARAAKATSGPLQQNIRQSTHPTYYVIGLARVGGVLSEYESVDDKAYICAILSDDQIDGLQAVYIKNTEVLFTEAGGILTVTTPPFGSASGSLVRLEPKFGGVLQSASTILTSSLPVLYAPKDNGAGMAYLVAEITQPAQDKFFTTFGGNVPEVGALVRGVYAFDPREPGASLTDQTTWKFETNPAIHFYRYCYIGSGMGVRASTINQSSIITVADHCDGLITTKTKGQRPRYEIGGIIRSDEAPRDVFTKILDTFDGDVYIDDEGLISLTCSDLDVATVVITDDMIIDLQLEQQVGQLYESTSVKSRFSSEDHGYIENVEEADQWDNVGAIASVGRPIPLEHDLPMVFRHDQARVLMKKKWYETNPDWKGEMTVDFNGIELIGERKFIFRHAPLDLDIEVKIESLDISEKLDSAKVRFVSVHSESKVFNYATEEGTAPKVSIDVSSSDAPRTPTNLTYVVRGTQAWFFWDLPPAGQSNEAQQKTSAAIDWTTIGTDISTGHTIVTGLTPAGTHNFRVRATSPEFGVSAFNSLTFTVANTAGTAGSLQSVIAPDGVMETVMTVQQSTSPVSVAVETQILTTATPLTWVGSTTTTVGPGRFATITMRAPGAGVYSVYARSVAADGTTGPVVTVTPVNITAAYQGGGSGGADGGGGGSSGGGGHPVYG